MSSDKSYETRMRELRVQYLIEIQDDLVEMNKTLGEAQAAARALTDEARARLRKLSHDLRGSGGAYGFPRISASAGDFEDLVVAGDGPSTLLPALATLTDACEAARAENTP